MHEAGSSHGHSHRREEGMGVDRKVAVLVVVSLHLSIHLRVGPASCSHVLLLVHHFHVLLMLVTFLLVAIFDVTWLLV